jgi:ABC-type multidrug transport system permease subunit
MQQQQNEKAKPGLGRRIFHSLLEAGAAILGGLLFFLCCYWFFHYETWHERLIAITLSVLVVAVIIKILPERPDQ